MKERRIQKSIHCDFKRLKCDTNLIVDGTVWCRCCLLITQKGIQINNLLISIHKGYEPQQPLIMTNKTFHCTHSVLKISSIILCLYRLLIKYVNSFGKRWISDCISTVSVYSFNEYKFILFIEKITTGFNNINTINDLCSIMLKKSKKGIIVKFSLNSTLIYIFYHQKINTF